jgi:hypothetical protein
MDFFFSKGHINKKKESGNMPSSDGINYEEIIEKGLEAAAVAFGTEFGGPIGAALAEKIISSLFSSGDEDKFADAIRALQESIRKTVDQAFLREHSGAIIGLGENLRTYFKTRDEGILHPLQNDITQRINTLIRFEPTSEVITVLVYGVNVYVLTLRALADYNNHYYQVVMDNTRSYSKQIEEMIRRFDEPVRSSIPEKTSMTFTKKQETICEGKPGAEYEISIFYQDQFMASNEAIAQTFPVKKCIPYPEKWGEPSGHDLNWKPDQAFFEGLPEFKSKDNRRLENKGKRTNELDRVVTPFNQAVKVWKDSADSIQSKIN